MRAERRDGVRLDLILLAAGCAAGAALSFSGAVLALLNGGGGLAAGAEFSAGAELAAGAGLVAGADAVAWRPNLLWSILRALFGVFGAWLGGYGTLLFAARRWHPALRAVEGVAFAALALGVAVLAGGFKLLPGTSFWALLAPSLPAWQSLFAWALALRLAQPICEATRASDEEATGAQGAVARTAGAGVAGATSAAEHGVWQSTYLALRGQLLAAAIVLACVWALASYAAGGDPGSGGFLAVAGNVALAVLGPLLLAAVHHRALQLEFKKEGVPTHPGFAGGIGTATRWIIVACAALALVIPVNLSPIRAWHFNLWMERLTERLGPLLVPSQAPGRWVGEGLGRLSLDRALEALAERGRLSDGNGGPLLLLVLMLAVLLYVARRVFGGKARGARAARMGRLPVGIRWLYEQIRAAILGWIARIFPRRGVPAEGEATASAAAGRPGRRARRGGWPDVTAVYVDVIERLGRRGIPRRGSETPLEFLERWRGDGSAGDEGLARLTDLYLAERYGENPPSPGVVAEARSAGGRALRALAWGRLRLRRRNRPRAEGAPR